MNLKENRHYANKYGVELNEYLKHNFNYEELVGWYTMQVLKYLVRAGKKDGESYYLYSFLHFRYLTSFSIRL